FVCYYSMYMMFHSVLSLYLHITSLSHHPILIPYTTLFRSLHSDLMNLFGHREFRHFASVVGVVVKSRHPRFRSAPVPSRLHSELMNLFGHHDFPHSESILLGVAV